MLTIVEQLMLKTLNEEIIGRYWMRRPRETNAALFADTDVESGIRSATIDSINQHNDELRSIRDKMLRSTDTRQLRNIVNLLDDKDYKLAHVLDKIIRSKQEFDDIRRAVVSFVERYISTDVELPPVGSVNVSPLMKPMREPTLGRPSLKRSMGL